VHFADTKEEKVEIIRQLGCTHFVDDLPEVLQSIDPSVSRILYDPHSQHEATGEALTKMQSWGRLVKVMQAE
jgi:hypothetical protein